MGEYVVQVIKLPHDLDFDSRATDDALFITCQDKLVELTGMTHDQVADLYDSQNLDYYFKFQLALHGLKKYKGEHDAQHHEKHQPISTGRQAIDTRR